ncbi:MAG: uncharacterized protein PWQ08_713 [Clostridiales bacterium]|nr:YeeE/YedE thiosulfate transporter family protein [Pygmaiobacter sp.]MDK2813458.1 uncharacterized protein [Clostridiales bacterium]
MKRWIKKAWPYWAGGLLLGGLNVLLLSLSGQAWQVSGGYLLWGAGILQKLGVPALTWDYFEVYNTRYRQIIADDSVFLNQYTILNLGVVAGALLATLVSSQFKWKKVKNKKQVAFALLGGILMGYGSRLAGGCNIGGFFSGLASFSLHAWVFWLFVAVGAFVGTRLLLRFLVR